jgi:O-antigen biosynthesis protein
MPDDVAKEPTQTVTEGEAKPAGSVKSTAARREGRDRAAAPAAPRPRPIVGHVDKRDGQMISGWVWDPERPLETLTVEILDGDSVLMCLKAGDFRTDLFSAGIGDGRHAFQAAGVGNILPLSRHRLRIRCVESGADLVGSPFQIIRPGIADGSIDFVEAAVATAAETATKDTDLAAPIAVVVKALSTLVNAQAKLAPKDAGGFLEYANGLDLAGRTRDLIQRLRKSYMPLAFDLPEKPEVSVVIPVFNQFKTTYDCLASILKALPERDFEIIVVDDGSDDETLFASLIVSGVRFTRNPANLGFVGASNAGAAVARGRYLLFLNNDTLVKPGWLDQLVATFERMPDVGVVGARLLNEDGTVQEVGGVINRLGGACQIGRGRYPIQCSVSYLRDADYVSGAALMIPRDLFEDLGAFDQLFAPAYYEDTDLCFRVQAAGRRVVVQPASEITHLEGASCGVDVNGTGLKRFQVINQAKFYRRWKSALSGHSLDSVNPDLESERHVRRRAFFIDSLIPTPDRDAGSMAALEHMKALIDMSFKVTFVASYSMIQVKPYTGDLQKLGIECLYSPEYEDVEDVFRKTKIDPEVVYIHRFENASVYASMARRYFPKCRIIYNVADLHFLRMERQAALGEGEAEAAAIQRRTELAAIRAVDQVIVHSSAEATLLQAEDPAIRVSVAPWTVALRPVVEAFDARSGCAFIGGFGHPPNEDAVRWLAGDILPLLVEAAPDCTTYIIGSKMPDWIKQLDRPGLRALGFAPDLTDALHRLRCTIAPLRYGAGVKGKVLESFAHGLPCVMSEIAAEGLDLPDELAWLVARSPREFADKVGAVHSNAGMNDSLAQAGLAFIAERYSALATRRALEVAVNA